MELESYFKKYFIYVFLLFLSGCAVKYHAAEDGPSGYRDAQVSSDVFYVEYTESANTDWNIIHGFALKRCAEIAKKKGYAFFDVLSKDEKTVYLESAVDQIVVANMGNLASDPPTATVYSTAGKRVEGRRVTYQIKLLNE
tara:strand:+ start:5682 stop:6101 length:420 start_codon:yes stop_codon:yes gene_type:complete